ncbi:MAG: hypothetical protein ABEJ98_05920 [Candidatus Nanohaloarchaea archaeon]
MELSIRTIAMVVLMTMFIALVFASFQGWFNEIVNQFLGSVLPHMEQLSPG